MNMPHTRNRPARTPSSRRTIHCARVSVSDFAGGSAEAGTSAKNLFSRESVSAMLHCHGNIAKAFSESRAAHAEESEAALRQIEEDMGKAWEGLGEGWQDLENRLVEIGIVKTASRPQESMVRLNIGGVLVNVRWLVLEGTTLGDLLEDAWDERVPRDEGGRVVIDESPMCVKYLIDVLKRSAGNVRVLEPIPLDEKAHLDYISGILGERLQANCPVPRDELVLPHSKVTTMVVSTGGTVLGHGELLQVMVHARKSSWFPGDPHKLELIYSSSRDGMNAEAFYSRCGGASTSTFTVVSYETETWVNPGGYRQTHGHIVGGFSDVPWTPSSGSVRFIHSANAFIFSLKHDGRDIDPKRYGLRKDHADYAISSGPNLGPSFAGDLSITFAGTDTGGTATIST